MLLQIRSGLRLAFPFVLMALMLGGQGMAVKDAPLGPDINQKEIRTAERQVDEAGCQDYRADWDLYAVCKKRGLPARRSSYGGFAYRPRDQDLAGAALPPECRCGDGWPKWNGAPEVIQPGVATSNSRHQLPTGCSVRSKPVLGGLHHDYRLEREAA